MIARKYLDNYSEIILNSLNLYSDNTTLRASDSMTSDETLLKMEELMKDNPAGVNQEIGQELSAGVKEKFLLDEDTNINIDDIKILRSINQKSVNAFNSDDIKKSEKWARKFYKEIGIKSPFFRAWFGDWGAYDSTKIWTKTTANGL